MLPPADGSAASTRRQAPRCLAGCFLGGCSGVGCCQCYADAVISGRQHGERGACGNLATRSLRGCATLWVGGAAQLRAIRCRGRRCGYAREPSIDTSPAVCAITIRMTVFRIDGRLRSQRPRWYVLPGAVGCRWSITPPAYPSGAQRDAAHRSPEPRYRSAQSADCRCRSPDRYSGATVCPAR